MAEGAMEELRTRFHGEGRTLEDMFLQVVGAEAG